MPENVLVLGGGVGGLVAANDLRKRLPQNHRVTLVDRESTFAFAPSFLWILIGHRTAEKISRPLARLEKKGIQVIRGEITRIDPVRRVVAVDDWVLYGDYVILALGAELAPEAVPGLAQAGYNFYTLQGAEGFRDAFAAFTGGRIAILTAVPAYKCPAAPYEAAMLVEYACRQRKIREHTQIDFYGAEPGPMGVAGPEVSKAVRQMVEAKGIAYHPERQIVAVDAAARRLQFSDGTEATYDLLAYVPPHRPPTVVRQAGLCGESGWVPVDRYTLETKYPRVYALGDTVSIPLLVGKPLPKAGVFAHYEAEVVARNIVRAVRGRGKLATFNGRGECFIETGDGKAGFGRGNFYAEPAPNVKLYKVGRHWHAGKVLFEQDRLHRWF